MEDRALALHPEELAAALAPLDDERLGGAGDEVGDDGVDRDPPAGDRDPRLPGRDEHRRTPRRRASRSSSSETVIFPIAQSEPTVSTIVPGTFQVLAGRGREVARRPAQVAQLDVVPRREVGSSASSREEHVQAVLDVEALPMQLLGAPSTPAGSVPLVSQRRRARSSG